MWCLCDLNISLQSTSSVESLVNFLSGIARMLFQGFQQIPKIITELVEKITGRTVFKNTIADTGAEGINFTNRGMVYYFLNSFKFTIDFNLSLIVNSKLSPCSIKRLMFYAYALLRYLIDIVILYPFPLNSVIIIPLRKSLVGNSHCELIFPLLPLAPLV